MRPTTQQPATTRYTHISRERPPRLLRHLLPLGPLGHTQHLLQLLLLVRRVCRYLRCDIELTTERRNPFPDILMVDISFVTMRQDIDWVQI